MVTTSKASRYASLQVMRALAAFLVLLFHQKILAAGYGGVDIFFVISGFVMGSVAATETPRQFAAKRLIRVLPLYWTVTIGMCVLSLAPHVFSHFQFNLTSLLKSLLFIPYSDQNGELWPLVVPGWTLTYEMFFYLVFALGLALKRPRLFAGLVMASLAASRLLLPALSPAAITYTSPLLLEFTTGLILSRLPLIRLPVALYYALFAIGLVAYACITSFSIEDHQDFQRLLWLGLPAFCLVGGALGLEQHQKWPRLRWLEARGDESYSLYLLHGIVIAFVDKIVPGHAVQIAAGIIVSLLLAHLSYRHFERPVSRFLHRQIRARDLN